jgi:hypothetical protein
MCNYVRFNYIFYDSRNLMDFGSKIYTNPDQLTCEVIEYNIRLHLISHDFFTPNCIGIRKFTQHRYQDHSQLFEFDSIEILKIVDSPKKKMESINNLLLKLERMTSYEIFLISDQPITCPKCGTRTELKLQLSKSPNTTQFHKCLSGSCKFFFAVEENS